VAFRWRIRHKLMLGLGLVVGLLALLLAGSFYGLASGRNTMKSTESKHQEWTKAQEFKSAVDDLRRNAGKPPAEFRLALVEAEKALTWYQEALDDTVSRGRDPNKGFQEKGLIEEIKKHLADLIAKLETEYRPMALAMGPSITTGNAAVVQAIDDLVDAASDLMDAINEDLKNRSQDAKETFRLSLWIMFSSALAGVILLCVFLRFFYRWVFSPIHDLEQGAGRVAQGDFEHHIEVHSGDEMEDLAAAFNDMTNRLREMYRDLARQVNERSRQLVRSERLAGVGFLAAGVAHEINNPLASIAFCSEALESRLADVITRLPGNGEVVSKYLKMIQKEAFRCKEITQKLLEFSRGADRRREPTNLDELIHSVLEVVKHLPNFKGKLISFEPTGRLVAWVNAPEIKSVILNLVVNALDSMEEGGTLTITLRQNDHMAEMEFADTGCGMSSEILENIFEPFFTRSRTGKGTGLGLSISHRVVSQHGGEIEAASAGPDRGSTFTVRLPLQPVELGKEETLGKLAA
jgi:signal transduction histidine kinase